MKNTQFCIECREETPYRIQPVSCKKNIRGKDYVFIISKAICEKCGEEINVPGLMDRNSAEIDTQYRAIEHIVTPEDIQNLMEIYQIGKAPLSLALGFGEITITRYLAGQVPSKDSSDIIRKALESPAFILMKLQENREKIGEAAYKKAMNAVTALKPLFSLSEKMLLSISYLFERAEEVTPLALQKMLYYIQGIYMVLHNDALFTENCLAWAHGPVFREVYDVFKGFKYNPIDDVRFALFKNRYNELSEDEKHVIDLVVESFGMYSGKALEKITHNEAPWLEAHARSLPNGHSNEIISKDAILKYFTDVAQKYKLDDVDGLNQYIQNKLAEK